MDIATYMDMVYIYASGTLNTPYGLYVYIGHSNTITPTPCRLVSCLGCARCGLPLCLICLISWKNGQHAYGLYVIADYTWMRLG